MNRRTKIRADLQRVGHSLSGNCLAVVAELPCRDGCQRGAVCDVCHKHDEPRGECSECVPCRACAALADKTSADRSEETP